MAAQILPRAGTNASRLLNAVYSLGGEADASEILAFIAEPQRTAVGYKALIDNLESRNLLMLRPNGVVRLTAVAKALFREKCPLPKRYEGQVALPRTPSAPVLRRVREPGPYRPGSDDYKKIPSLHAPGIRKLPSGEVVE